MAKRVKKNKCESCKCCTCIDEFRKPSELKPLNTLSRDEYELLRDSGYLYEFYSEATGDSNKDLHRNE